MYTEPERTSICAILSLVLALLGCCTLVTAPLGLLLGIIGVIGIARSNGRVGGMGFAIAGIIIGLLVTVLSGAMVFGVYKGVEVMDREISKPMAQVMLDLQSDDFDGARAGLAKPAADATDEELIAFREAYKSTLGGVISTPDSVWAYFGGWMSLGQHLQHYQGRQDMIPIPMQFDQGMGLVVMIYNPQQQQQAPRAQEIHVVDPQGNVYTLPWTGSSTTLGGSDADADADAETDSDADPGTEDAPAEDEGP
jgi:hypothetical protein